MKKIFLTLLVLASFSASAQKKKPAAKAAKTSGSAFYNTPYASRNSGSFDKSAHLITIHYGLPNQLDYSGYFGYNTYNNEAAGIGPVTLRYEFPVRDEVGVGLAISGATKSYNYYGGSDTDILGISASPMGFYHFNKLIPVPRLDVYAGIGASIDWRNYSYNTVGVTDDSTIDVNPAGLVGVRYYFTDSLSAMAEGGEGSFSNFRIGVSFRL